MGSDYNAYYLKNVDLIKHLMQDIALIPLRSNIYTSKFACGRVLATSASVEGEINKIINVIIGDISSRIRIDKSVELYLSDIQGKDLLINAKLDDKARESTKVYDIISSAKSCTTYSNNYESSTKIEKYVLCNC